MRSEIMISTKIVTRPVVERYHEFNYHFMFTKLCVKPQDATSLSLP